MLLVPMAIHAQRQSNGRHNASKAVVSETVDSEDMPQEEMNFEKLLPSTAKVMFVDSLIVSNEEIVDNIPLSKSAGKVEVSEDANGIIYQYTNELQNNRIISACDEKGNHTLFSMTRLGRGWSEPEVLTIPGDFTDIICPYLMSDGITLYFSARGGEDNLGKHDIFYTVYNPENGGFITPQSVGLPFNSFDDDLYYMIDEVNNLGYLVTNRRQDSKNLCIYTFIPTEVRETYSEDDTDEDMLASLARITSIHDTHFDPTTVEQAKVRLAEAKNSAQQVPSAIHFPISSSKSYTTLGDFKTPENRAKYTTYANRKSMLAQQEERLRALRKNFRSGQTYTADEIVELEKAVEAENKTLQKLASEIRQAEKEQ